MKRVLQIFDDLTKLDRCSKEHEDFIDYIKNFVNSDIFDVIIDDFNNILVKKKDSKSSIALQSHYDIVCIGSKSIKIYENNGFLRAKDSTLGADNGIGVASMLHLIEQHRDCEYIFTADEEIGLIGANGFNEPLNAKYMINLDSEDIDTIFIGCAGGVDIKASYNISFIESEDEKFYDVSASNYQGGHSGVDIDKNIPNAIIELLKNIKNSQLVSINGGERINSIPRNAKAIVSSNNSINDLESKEINSSSTKIIKDSNKIINNLLSLRYGVLEYSDDIVKSSINFSKISTNNSILEVELSLRSIDNSALKELENSYVNSLESFGFTVESYGKYGAWKPIHSKFIDDVLKLANKDKGAVIHAGLECAVFKNRYKDLEIVSIGPNIENPHSTSERVEIKSIQIFLELLNKILKRYGA